MRLRRRNLTKAIEWFRGNGVPMGDAAGHYLYSKYSKNRKWFENKDEQEKFESETKLWYKNNSGNY